jgi:hypothetical protein
MTRMGKNDPAPNYGKGLLRAWQARDDRKNIESVPSEAGPDRDGIEQGIMNAEVKRCGNDKRG